MQSLGFRGVEVSGFKCCGGLGLRDEGVEDPGSFVGKMSHSFVFFFKALA